MRIGVPKERLANETRVAATPKTVEQLLKLGFTVAIESGAGKLASFDDEAFTQAGADVVDGAEVWQSPIILKVNAPEESEIELLNRGHYACELCLASPKPGADGEAGSTWCHRDGDGLRAAHFARAVSGCA